MLQRDGEPPLAERHRKLVDEADKSLARIVELVAELSEVAKLDSGAAAVAHERFDLFELLANLGGEVREGSDRDGRLELSGPSVGAPMRGDVARLRSAFISVFRAVLREQPAACTVVAERRLATDALKPCDHRRRSRLGAGAFEAPPGAFDENRGGLACCCRLPAAFWSAMAGGSGRLLRRGPALLFS
jgi:hypothetical protein